MSARWHNPPATDPGLFRFTVLALLAGLLFVALLWLGQDAVCWANSTDGPHYCTEEER